MENRNEIGKLFKDKLELLDKKPSDNLWASIETDLNKKRKRRVLFWLIPSLITAVIAISILFFTQAKQDKGNNGQIPENQNTISKTISSQDKDKAKISKLKENTIYQSGKSGGSKKTNAQDVDTKLVVTKAKPIIRTIVEPSTETKTIIKKNRFEKLIKQSSKLIASTEDYEEYEVVKKYKVIVKKNKTITTTYKASKTKTAKTTPKKKMITSSKKKTSNSKKKPKNRFHKTSKTIIPNSTDSINSTSLLKKEIKNEALLDIAKADTIKKDSLPKKEERKPTTKREYVKRDYPEQKSETDPEYSISAYYGPAIFGSNESTINKSFNDFSKSHPITSHYGFYFKSMYGKIGFRVGIAKINLKTITSVNNDPSSIRYENIKMDTYNSTDIDNRIKNDGGGKFEQKISYYEVPLEFNYNLKKDETPFGIDAFTGFSILILDANQLSFF